MTGPDPYQYLDYRRYLRDWFDARKAANPRFSHRSFARQAGQSSPSLLLYVMEGKRNLTAATTEAFSRAMGLTGDAATYFAALVTFNQAESLKERSRAWEGVRAVRRFREARRLENDAVEYLRHWYYPAIRELAACPGFEADPAWIAANLNPPIAPAEAQRAVAALLSLGFLERREDGRLAASEASLVTPHEVQGFAAMAYHRGMSERAQDALEAVPFQERHYLALTVAIPPSLVPRLKQELDALQERMLDLCDAAEDTRARVYQVNLQLFPLSASLPGEPR